MPQSRRLLRQCRRNRHWQIWRPRPRTGLQGPAPRSPRSAAMKWQPHEGGQREWQTLDFPGRRFGEGGGVAAFSGVVVILRVLSRSGTLTAALVGLGVVVAALLADPVT